MVTSDFLLNFKISRWYSRDFEYHLMTDQKADEFINDNFPGRVADAYNSLMNGAARADIWRLLVLYKYGGVYLYVDACFSAPLRWILNNGDDEIFITDRSGEITNYFIASRSGNEKLLAVVRQIILNIEERAYNNVFDLTGPSVIRQLIESQAFNTRHFRGIAMHGQITVKSHQYVDRPKGHWSLIKDVNDIVDQDFVPDISSSIFG